MKTIAFFNNKGGVGKTSLVYHLAWMFSDMGVRVLAADLDPQSNLTSMFMPDEEIESLWPESGSRGSILESLRPIIDHTGDLTPVEPLHVGGPWLIPGDLGLTEFEDRAAEGWNKCREEGRGNRDDGFRVMTALYRTILAGAVSAGCDVALIDVGPNVGALNRAALVAADYVVVPLGADLFSLQGLRNLGPTLGKWRSGWSRRLTDADLLDKTDYPKGEMKPLGYVLLNPSTRDSRPVQAYAKWANRIPSTYASSVLSSSTEVRDPNKDVNQLAQIKHYKSLMPLAQERRKPMFHLKAADGAIGGHAAAVQNCYDQFEYLAGKILVAIGGE